MASELSLLSHPEVWAGLECTVNRIGDRYHDQCLKNGHCARLDDLRLFQSLGIRRLRYPFLWEKAVSDHPDRFDWSWADERLGELRRLDLKPIAGLLHHGSGPRFTQLDDAAFPEYFARYARAFAERYPFVDDYTPINEPLTTARFSCLYGHWYPHARDDRSFVRATFLQAKATLLAFRAIREVNPSARLIQTEDFGRTESSPAIARQRDFENARRWLSLDMISGLIDESYPLYDYLVESGLEPSALEWLRANGRMPDVIGINHYLLSNRFLDERRDLYPEAYHATNGFEQYADVPAVDTARAVLPEPVDVFREVWRRYGLPIAITEVHVRGHVETRMRWLHEIWNAAVKLRREGADVRAVTAWSLLGSYDWNSLCTQDLGFYEPGVYERTTAGEIRSTLLGEMIRGLACDGNFEHPTLEQPGWWRTSERILLGREEVGA